jgi:NAD(P)H-flavin reductase
MQLPAFSDYRPARLRAARAAAAEQSWLLVEPPDGFLDAHRRAGQFCKIRRGEVEGIFAMYSAPAEREARFLVRVGAPVGGDAATELASLEDGAPIEMSLPAGAGFDLASARGRDVCFVATGTGVAPVRAALEEVLAERAHYGALSFDYGLRTQAHLAIADELARWEHLGVEIRLSYSQLEGDGAPVGTTVQQALRDRGPDLARARVVAVGQPEMLAELGGVVTELGGAAKSLLTNI